MDELPKSTEPPMKEKVPLDECKVVASDITGKWEEVINYPYFTY